MPNTFLCPPHYIDNKVPLLKLTFVSFTFQYKTVPIFMNLVITKQPQSQIPKWSRILNTCKTKCQDLRHVAQKSSTHLIWPSQFVCMTYKLSLKLISSSVRTIRNISTECRLVKTSRIDRSSANGRSNFYFHWPIKRNHLYNTWSDWLINYFMSLCISCHYRSD